MTFLLYDRRRHLILRSGPNAEGVCSPRTSSPILARPPSLPARRKVAPPIVRPQSQCEPAPQLRRPERRVSLPDFGLFPRRPFQWRGLAARRVLPAEGSASAPDFPRL